MKEPRKDDERLSALLEGQVHGRERDELLAHLAASDDDYAVFTDTARVLRALEEEDARAAGTVVEEEADGRAAGTGVESDVIPLRPAGRGWGAPVRLLALAATVAGIVVVSSLVLRKGTPVGGSPVQLAVAVHTPGQRLPKGWTETWPWTGVRGDGRPSAARQVESAQAGVMMMRLAVAARARDPDATKRLAQQAQDRFEQGVGGNTPLRRIISNPGAPPEVLEGLLDEATARLADDLEGDYLRLGAWAQAASEAAAARKEEFFRDDPSPDMLRSAVRLTRGDDVARAAAEAVREAIPEHGEPAWPALQSSLTVLLREITS